MAKLNIGRVQGSSIWSVKAISINETVLNVELTNKTIDLNPLINDLVLIDSSDVESINVGDVYKIVNINDNYIECDLTLIMNLKGKDGEAKTCDFKIIDGDLIAVWED